MQAAKSKKATTTMRATNNNQIIGLINNIYICIGIRVYVYKYKLTPLSFFVMIFIELGNSARAVEEAER